MSKTTKTITIEVNRETSGITVEYGNDMSAELVLGILRLAMLHEEEKLRELWSRSMEAEKNG